MKQWKIVLARLMKPGLPWLLLLTGFCAPALFYIFYQDLNPCAAMYLVYVLSAYTLSAWMIRVPNMVKRIRSAIYGHHLGQRYMTDFLFRGRLSLHLSTAVNLFYALFKLGAGIYYRSFWFGAIAVYYLILTLTRGSLLRSTYKKGADRKHEYQTARLCGWLLFIMNFALSAVTIQMVIDGKGYAYPGSLIFVVALYAFYSITNSIVNLIRFRKLNSPVLSASKVLGVATALVSMLSLQTAMFASFGDAYEYQGLMNALTGGAVCLLIFVMAVLMISKANFRIKEFSINKS